MLEQPQQVTQTHLRILSDERDQTLALGQGKAFGEFIHADPLTPIGTQLSIAESRQRRLKNAHKLGLQRH
ncbi:hypothetical protein [Plesiocystis pacifica]|uniref:hypothetical protein n=1 Tax=Plesiocystis pacifica TaxID=191768 RepID=UPI0018DD38F6|nr:hypothetical protein [Plesiocystis pacifica]